MDAVMDHPWLVLFLGMALAHLLHEGRGWWRRRRTAHGAEPRPRRPHPGLAEPADLTADFPSPVVHEIGDTRRPELPRDYDGGDYL